MTTTHQSSTELPAFPKKARDYLDSFYIARNVKRDDVRGKIAALRHGYGLEDAIIAADGGFSPADDEELRALEFYVLTTKGVL